MKVHQIVCPKCKASLTSKAGIEEGTSIPCPKCKTKFAVAASSIGDEVIEDFEVVDEEEEESPKKASPKTTLKPLAKQRPAKVDDDEQEGEEDETPRKAASKAALKPLSKKRSADNDDDEDRPKKSSKAFDQLDDDDKPVAKKKRPKDEDDEDSPRSKRKRRDDDDEEDEPKSAYGKLKSNIYIRAGVLGALLVVLGVVGYLYYDKTKNNKTDDSTQKKDPEDDLGKPNPKYVTQPTTKKKAVDNPNPGKGPQGNGRVRFDAQGFSIVKPADWQYAANLPGAFAGFRGPPTAPQLTFSVLAQPYDNTPLDQIGAQLKSILPKQLPSFRFEQEGMAPIDGQQAYFMVYSISVSAKGKAMIDITTIQYYLIGKNKKNMYVMTFGDLATEFNSHRKQFEEMAATAQTD